MNSSVPSARDVILLGGGHSNIQVLRYFGMHDQPGVRLTLVSENAHSPYSGMVPGAIAGIYEVEDTYINLERLCQFAGGRFVRGEVTGLDLANRRVFLNNRPSLHYDALSLNIGSEKGGFPIFERIWMFLLRIFKDIAVSLRLE